MNFYSLADSFRELSQEFGCYKVFKMTNLNRIFKLSTRQDCTNVTIKHADYQQIKSSLPYKINTSGFIGFKSMPFLFYSTDSSHSYTFLKVNTDRESCISLSYNIL